MMTTPALPSFSRRSRRQDALACVLLLCLCTLWALTLALPFQLLDDYHFIRLNKYVIDGLSWQSITWAFTTGFGDYWHPFTWLSILLDSTLFGMHPWGFHLTNDILHACNALLLYLILRSILGHPWKCFIAAALFAIHPQRVESVAWAVERKDVLAAFFGFLAILAYLRFVRTRRAVWYLAICFAYFASLLSKPMLVTFPALLLLLDFWPLGRLERTSLWPLVREKIPLALLALDGAVNTFMHGLTDADYRGTHSMCVQNTIMNYAYYLRDFFYPAHLVFFPAARDSFPWWQIAVAASFLTGTTAAILLAWKRRWPGARPLLFGWLWYIIAMLPMSGIAQAGYSMRGDRFTYIPTLGIVIALVWGIAPRIWIFRRTAPAAAVTILVLLFFGTFTVNRILLWRNSLALYEHDLVLDPQNGYLHHLAARAAGEDNLPALERYHNIRAAELDPFDFVLPPSSSTTSPTSQTAPATRRQPASPGPE